MTLEQECFYSVGSVLLADLCFRTSVKRHWLWELATTIIPVLPSLILSLFTVKKEPRRLLKGKTVFILFLRLWNTACINHADTEMHTVKLVLKHSVLDFYLHFFRHHFLIFDRTSILGKVSNLLKCRNVKNNWKANFILLKYNTKCLWWLYSRKSIFDIMRFWRSRLK